MNYLFIHQNFPAQYRHVTRYLADQPGNQVYFITQPNENEMPGVHKITYPKDMRGPINCHAYAAEIDRAIHTGATVAEVCRDLAAGGFRPDLIIGHSGWGETLFVKDVFPDVPLLANFEFYYHARGVDVGFDPEFVTIFNDPSRLRARNGVNLLAFQAADWGHSATEWQRGLNPPEMQSRISVLHEGVDTALACPNEHARFEIPLSKRVLTRRDEVVTYVARNLEPYRGFHIFMRSLPELLRRRKHAQVVIVGAELFEHHLAVRGARRRHRPVARTFSRHARLSRLPQSAAGLLRARLSDLPVRAVLVADRGDGVRMPDRGLGHAAGARGHARWREWNDGGFFRPPDAHGTCRGRARGPACDAVNAQSRAGHRARPVRPEECVVAPLDGAVR
jgi:glycosyltransferase involved in cell wall biosynthesis